MNILLEMKKYEKSDDIDSLYYHPVLFPKILSFNIKKIYIAELMSLLSFHISEIGNKMLFKYFCDDFDFKEFQKATKNKNSEYKFVFDKIKNYFNLSQKEFDEIKPLLEKQIQNKDTLLNILLFFGAPIEEFKKHKLNLNIDFQPKKENEISIRRWF
jgi:hypothetical protein